MTGAPTGSAVAPELAEQLLTYISAARWFGGKGRRAVVVGRTTLPWLTDPSCFDGPDGLAVRPEVVELAYPGTSAAGDPAAGADAAEDDGAPSGPHELYQLVVAYRPEPRPELQSAQIGRWEDAELGPVVAYDAAQDPAASAVLLTALLAQTSAESESGTVSFHLSAAEGLTPDLAPKVFTGQQSNTSVMYGEVAMLKLFRRLELGRNLDIEVHDALSRSGMSDVARLFGWAEASWSGTDPTSRQPARLRADLAMVVEKLADATDGWGLALDVLGAGEDFTGHARDLGAALAETHAALRSAFPHGGQPGAEVAAVMSRRLDVAAGIAPALAPYVAGLREVFAALADRELELQRVHGDFHLGQTLHTPSGWKIIDFEGEPAKTLAERAAPDSVWRDIAGMLRSFDYCAASLPGEDARAGAQACRSAFLSGYAGGQGADDDAVLRAYEADKAVYEVVYETRNRPDWLAIPLAAVEALTGGGSGTRGAATPPGVTNQGKE